MTDIQEELTIREVMLRDMMMSIEWECLYFLVLLSSNDITVSGDLVTFHVIKSPHYGAN